MKIKKLLAMLMVAFLLFALTACGGEASVDDATTAITTTTQTETTTTETATETETETTTEPQMQLNTDLLADLGRTFEEVRERRGQPTETMHPHRTTQAFTFERGFGYYIFADNNGNINPTNILLSNQILHSISELQLVNVFTNLAQAVSGSEFANIYGVQYISSYVDKHDDIYRSDFSYRDIIISIPTGIRGTISHNDLISPASVVIWRGQD